MTWKSRSAPRWSMGRYPSSSKTRREGARYLRSSDLRVPLVWAAERVLMTSMALAQRGGDAECAPLFPAPGLADLDRLLSRTASAGVRVDMTCCGQPRELPASIDLSAYRIV